MKEIWKDVKGLEGYYQVSGEGFVKSLDRVDCSGRHLKGMLIKPFKDRGGYLCVVLTKEGKRYRKKVHRLVAEAFIPNPEGKPEVDHIDTVQTNNCVENLRWVTAKENNNNALSIEHRGAMFVEGFPLRKYAEAWGLSAACLKYRLQQGWDIVKAVMTPVQRRKNESAR